MRFGRPSGDASELSHGILPKWASPWAWAVAALCWVTLWNAVRIDWETNPQYAFGWSTPFIAFCFFLVRWSCRPVPQPLSLGTRAWICAGLAGLFFLHLPVRLVEEANAEWRLLYWIRCAQCIGVSFGLLALAGGRPWVRHFAFPVLFPAIAVPWPTALETGLIQGLTRSVAAISVEGLFWLHIPAIRMGNVVQLASGAVGLNEACSGLRSLQSSLMLALAVGEFWRLAPRRRVLLASLGSLTAFGLNSLRTLSLSVVANNAGRAAFDRWHDTAGNIEAGCCILGVLVFGLLLRRTDSTPEESSGCAGSQAIPGWLPLLASGVWLLAEASTQCWFSGRSETHLPLPQWRIVQPPSGDSRFAGFKPVPIPEIVKTQLRTSDGVSYSWRQADGPAWNLTFVQWPEGRLSAASAGMHRPDVCLPAAGYCYDGEGSPVTVPVKGLPIAFRHYLFDTQTRPVQVFFSLLNLNRASENRHYDLDFRGRVQAALAGRRNSRQAILEITVSGAPNSEAPTRALPFILNAMLAR